MKQYAVKQLAALSGISVRTLHYYDQIGLLKPTLRTEAGYRLYGEQELLRLQQILMYRELDIPLKEIAGILDDPDFDLLEALESHKAALQQRKRRLQTLLETIDKTIYHVKNKTMLSQDELYEGLPKDKAEAWRDEASEAWPTAFKRSETHLRSMQKSDFKQLKDDFNALWQRLGSMTDLDPKTKEVQQLIEQHYHFIRRFWGTTSLEDKQAEAYIGLGDMYALDERFTEFEGKPNPAFGPFMQAAMQHFAESLSA